MQKENTQGSQDGAYAPEPRIYELGYHLIPSLDEEDIEKEREALVATITTLSGNILQEEKPSLIDLAYTIEKVIDNKKNGYRQAHFGWIKFTLSPENLALVKKDVEREDNILRYLLIKTVEEDTIYSEKPYKLVKQPSSYEEQEEEDSALVVEINGKEVSEEKIESLIEDGDKVSEEKKSAEKGNDLTKIEGIGPKIAEIFRGAGIHTFADLANAAVEKLREILKENKLSSHDPETWPTQAKLADEEKWDELHELQDALKGGRKE